MSAKTYQRIVEFAPAYDKRHADPKKNYGIHGVELRFVLKGSDGAVQFVLFTQWQLPHVTKETDERTAQKIRMGGDADLEFRCFYHPMPADLGYHSPKPIYEGQEPIGAVSYDFSAGEEQEWNGRKFKMPKRVETGTFTPCPYLDGKRCYYDGSGLNAELVYSVLLREDSDGVWHELERYYAEIFDRNLANRTRR